MENARQQRAEIFSLHGLARRQRKRAERAAVKAAVKRDELVALRVIPRELHRRFDSLGAGISEIDALRALARRNGRELFGELDHALIVKIGAGHVDQLGRLLLNGGDHLRMAVPGGDYGNSRGEIEESISVHVLHHGAATRLCNQRVIARIGGRNHGVVALDNLLRFRAG